MPDNLESTSRTDDDRTFSVVIPAWNEAQYIAATLHAATQAIDQQLYSGNIIVVDNNSSDDTATKATQAGATVVFEPVNQIARARNTGARASCADWLVFVDADSIINPSLLTSSLASLANGSAIGGGSTVTLDRDVKGLTKRVLRLWNWWSVKSRSAAGCYIYCTREAFDTIGQFDEKQYAAEELYLSKKFRKLAKQRGQKFFIHTHSPVVSSARKIDWYTPKQLIRQVLLLLIPGATRSKKLLGVWYDRSHID